MKLSVVAIDSLTLDPKNARKHDERNIQEIAASLEEFGQQTPIVIDADDVVLKGNGQVMAAQRLGWNDIKAVRSKLTGEEAKKYAIADNRTSDLSEWDYEQLIETLGDLEDITATGFTQEEIDELLESVDERPEVMLLDPEEPETEDPKPTRQTKRFPLSIVLTASEHSRWKRFAGNRSDRDALLKLLEKA